MKILCNKCIKERKTPLLWKTDNVLALHKKDSKLDPLNCILCKVYEKFLRRHVLKIVDGKINKYQHGFIVGKSCFSNLVVTIDSILDMLEQGYPVDIFTLISGRLLIKFHITKLENYGVGGHVLDIIRDFLSGRTLRTYFSGCYSSSSSRIF